MITVRITGMDEARKALAKLGEGHEALLDPAVVAGSLVIQNEAKILAPKKSGNLSRSIDHERVA